MRTSAGRVGPEKTSFHRVTSNRGDNNSARLKIIAKPINNEAANGATTSPRAYS